MTAWASLPFHPPDDFQSVLLKYKLDGRIYYTVAYMDPDGDWMHDVPGDHIAVDGVPIGWRECEANAEAESSAGSKE